MAYWMVTCSVYLYIAILGANIRICRGQGRERCRHGSMARDAGRVACTLYSYEPWSEGLDARVVSAGIAYHGE